MTRLLVSRIERAEHRQRQLQRGGGSHLANREPRAEGDCPHRPYWPWQRTVRGACIIAGHLGGWTPGMPAVEALEGGIAAASTRPALAYLSMTAKCMGASPSRTRISLVKESVREAIEIADVGPPQTVLGCDVGERAFAVIRGHRQLAEAMTAALLSRPDPDTWKWHDWSCDGYADPQANPLAATAAAVFEVGYLSGVGLEYGLIEEYAPAAPNVSRLWADLDVAAAMKAEADCLEQDLASMRLALADEDQPPAYVAHIHSDDILALWVAQSLNDPDRMNASALETTMRDRAQALADAM